MHAQLAKELESLKNPEKAQLLQRFFKTGKGEYGEGDKFLGIMVPQQRTVAKKYVDISLDDLQKIISSSYHEFRLTAFIILTYKYAKADDQEKKEIFNYYIKNHRFANNWDIVDVTTPKVIGYYLLENPKEKVLIYKYAKSKILWERRIAVLACFPFISRGDFEDVIKLAELLLKDKQDLMHKATGWMLREVGKRDQSVLEKFLDEHIQDMPRTMLRYAIEKFPEKKRKDYLKK